MMRTSLVLLFVIFAFAKGHYIPNAELDPSYEGQETLADTPAGYYRQGRQASSSVSPPSPSSSAGPAPSSSAGPPAPSPSSSAGPAPSSSAGPPAPSSSAGPPAPSSSVNPTPTSVAPPPSSSVAPNVPATQILAVTISKPFNNNLLNPATADFKNLKLSLEADLQPLLCDLVAFPLCEVEVLGFSSGSTVANTQVKNSSPASVQARQATIATSPLPKTGGTVSSATPPTTAISQVGTDCTSSDAVCNGEGQRCKATAPKTCECNAPNFVSDGATGCKPADQCMADSEDDAMCKATDPTRPVCKDKKCIPKSKSAFFIVVFPATFDAAIHDTPAKKTALKGLLEPKLCAGITSGSCTIVESSIKLKAGSTEVSFEAQVPDLDSTPSADTLKSRLVGVTDPAPNPLGKSTAATGTPTDFNKCTSTSKCADGEGDCDGPEDCVTGFCGTNNCGSNMDPLADCCYNPATVIGANPTNTNGQVPNIWTYCTDKVAAGQTCKANEGDCDNDDECEGSLKCGRNSCSSTFNTGFDANSQKWFPSGQADCCITATRALFYGIPSRSDLEEDFQNDDEPF